MLDTLDDYPLIAGAVLPRATRMDAHAMTEATSGRVYRLVSLFARGYGSLPPLWSGYRFPYATARGHLRIDKSTVGRGANKSVRATVSPLNLRFVCLFNQPRHNGLRLCVDVVK